ncbi:MAG: hypothetical protein FWD76_05745 [Firmicutes bacterium]|nr:hypothetical protein [Bacillota bacterium]
MKIDNEKKQIVQDSVYYMAVGGKQNISLVEEFAKVDGVMEAVKVKRTTKWSEPDFASAKYILDNVQNDFEDMSLEQLQSEKERLLQELRLQDLSKTKQPTGKNHKKETK